MALTKVSETEHLTEILQAEQELLPKEFSDYVLALSMADRELYLYYQAARALRSAAIASSQSTPGDTAMLSKCANPNCNEKLLRLSGRIFLAQTKQGTQYFWLCHKCAPHFRVSEAAEIVPITGENSDVEKKSFLA